MTDTEKKTTAKAKSSTPKAKAKTKPKTTAKSKSRSKIKPKTEAKKQTSTAEVAPFMRKDTADSSPDSRTENNRSSTSLIVLVGLAIIVMITAYKFNEELNSLPAQAGIQESSSDTELATTSKGDSGDNTGMPSAHTHDHSVPHDGTTQEQLQEPIQSYAARYDEMMRQSQQTYENAAQARQRYQEIMRARQQSRSQFTEEQKAELLQIRKNQLETRKKVQEIHEQISALHEQLHQIMRESHERR
jgi:hypothetical protein